MYWVYFIESTTSNKVYVGFSSKDPNIRVKEHNQGSNKWTHDNGPFILRYYECYYCKKDAMSREKFYKMGFGKSIKQVIIETLKDKSGIGAISAKG